MTRTLDIMIYIIGQRPTLSGRVRCVLVACCRFCFFFVEQRFPFATNTAQKWQFLAQFWRHSPLSNTTTCLVAIRYIVLTILTMVSLEEISVRSIVAKGSDILDIHLTKPSPTSFNGKSINVDASSIVVQLFTYTRTLCIYLLPKCAKL